MDVKGSNIRTFLGVIVLVFITAAFYAPVITFDFIAEYDDQFYLIDNPILEKPSIDGFISIFTSFRQTDYLPVLYASFFLDALVWGQNPAGFHLTNLILHAVNGILLFILLSNILDSRPTAFFVALIFLTHPVQVESVAWVPERKNLLVMLFLLMAFHYTLVKRREWLGLSCYGLALFCKSIATVFPVFVLLALPVVGKKLRSSTVVIMFVLALIVSVLTYVSQSQVGAIKSYHGGSFATTVILMGQSYWDYLFSLLTGRGVSPLHSIPPINWSMGIGLYGAVLATALFLWIKKEWFLLRAMGAFFLFLLPVSNLIPIAVLQADRYLYIPIIFFFLALLTVFDRSWRKAVPERPQIGIWLVGTLLFISYAPAIAQYLPVYKDAHAMWSHVSRKPGLRGTAYYNLGVVEEKEGNIPSAMAWYEKARHSAGHCSAVNNMGAILFDRGIYEHAHQLFLEATAKCPCNPGIMYNLALSYIMRQDTEKARVQLDAVVEHGQYQTDLVQRAKEILKHIDKDTERAGKAYRWTLLKPFKDE